ncbi:uncharacterized protein TNCV_5110701 [Trichonephila clavipes]|nr:uncharacterized protein TNCV_5110701 [Trichonephila clavipes]
MFKNCRKEDLRIIALELELIQYTIEDRKKAEEDHKRAEKDRKRAEEDRKRAEEDRKRAEEDRKRAEEDRKRAEEDRKRAEEDRKRAEENRLREKELELELARLNVRVNSDNERTGEGCNTLDALVKSVRILTVKVPNRPEGWAFFFASLERAFVSKNVPEKFKSEILLNLLGEKASNVLTYVKDDELNNYEQLKSIILREYEPSANQFLEQFKKATRHPNETYIQYTSRLITNWQYYLKLRKVSDFDKNDLIVSDKIFSSLEKEVASHLSIRAGNDWFRPLELAKEIDLYNTSRGKSLKTLPNVLTRNNPVKNASRAADNLEHSIKFWEIENVEIDSVKTSELDICEDHFKSTHSRDDQGRYTVAMLLKEDPSCLGESRQTAIQRLNSLWKRLSRDKEYLSLYEKFLQEYEDLGHMREIKADGSGVCILHATPWCLSPRKVYN